MRTRRAAGSLHSLNRMAPSRAIRTRSRRLSPPGALRPPTSAAGFACRAISRRGSTGCAGERSREEARAAFLAEVEAGAASFDLLRHPLLPYQREGMLHLAFGERALLADEMGLGKTIQAIAACELLARRKGIAARAGGLPGLAQGGMGGADRALHRPPGALGVRAPAGAPCRLPRARHSSPSSTTSRCWATPRTSTRYCSPTSSCSTRRSASRTGRPRRRGGSSRCARPTPSC